MNEFKILVLTGWRYSAAVGISSGVIEFDTRAAADLAFDKLTEPAGFGPFTVAVRKLY